MKLLFIFGSLCLSGKSVFMHALSMDTEVQKKQQADFEESKYIVINVFSKIR